MYLNEFSAADYKSGDEVKILLRDAAEEKAADNRCIFNDTPKWECRSADKDPVSRVIVVTLKIK